MLKSSIIVLCIWLIFAGPIAIAQETPRIVHYTHESILNDQIWSLTQAHGDRMYYGTSNGILSYDGSIWTILEESRNTIIRSVAGDKEGLLYTGSYNEFGYWEADKLNQLQYHSLSNNIVGGIGGKEEIWHILPTGNAVYFQSFSTIYKYSQNEVVKLKPPGNIMFLNDVNGTVLFQKIDGGIYALNPNMSFSVLQGTEYFSDKKVVFILADGDEGLLIGTEQNGIFTWKNGAVSVWASRLQSDFRYKFLNKGVALSNGNFAFGTILDGLFVLEPSGKLKYHLHKQNGLPDNTVLSMHEDNCGNLWLGLDSGIALIDVNNPLQYFADVPGDLGSIYTAALYEDDLYIGTNHGVFYRQDHSGDSAAHGDFQFIEGTQGQVWQLKELNGQLLCGHNDGTFVLEAHSLRKISPVDGGWDMAIFPDSSELLLEGTYSGLLAYDYSNTRGYFYAHRIEDFLEPIKELVIDRDGSIWLAHPIEGLFRVALNETKTGIAYLQEFTQSNGLTSTKTPRIVLDGDNIIVRVNERWYRYDDTMNYFMENGQFRGISLDKLEGLIIPGSGTDWFEVLPTETILHRSEDNYSLPVTLVGRYENIVTIDSSRYFFCMNEGFAMLDVRDLIRIQHDSVPVLGITNLSILGGDNGANVLLGNEPVQLANDENNLRFQVYQPLFNRKPLFRYYLEGIDSKWTEWTESPEKEYFNLPAGDYKFNAESKFGAYQSTLNFSVTPHWSRSYWAMMVYLVCVASLVWGVQSYYNIRLKRAKQKHDTEQQRLILEQQMYVHNEKLQSDVMAKSKELANSTINLARKNEILLEIKNSLKNLKRTSGGLIPGKEYQHINHIIDMNLSSEEDWKLFEENFTQVHASFFHELKTTFPTLTNGDLQLAAFLKMNLSSKEIAPLLHISVRGVENKRYRLRKKLSLSQDYNLTEYMMRY